MTEATTCFIESRDPFDVADTAFVADTAAALAARGRAVTVFLVQNGVLATPRGAPAARRCRASPGRRDRARRRLLAAASAASSAGELGSGSSEASIGTLVDLMIAARH